MPALPAVPFPGYVTLRDGALAWHPGKGWARYTMSHRIGYPHDAAHAASMAREHARRLAAHVPDPGDLPACLVDYHPGNRIAPKGRPWRRVPLDPATGQRCAPSWWGSLAEARGA